MSGSARERPAEEEEYLVTLFVQGDDAAPRYRAGDRLLCAPKGIPEVGQDIVVVVRDGNIRVGRLAAIDGSTVTIEQYERKSDISRDEIGALWPVRLMVPEGARLPQR